MNGIITDSYLKGILHDIALNYGEERTAQYLTDLPRIIHRYQAEHPLTVGIRYCLPSNQEAQKLVRETIAETRIKIEALGPKLADPLEEEIREGKIKTNLTNMMELGKQIVRKA